MYKAVGKLIYNTQNGKFVDCDSLETAEKCPGVYLDHIDVLGNPICFNYDISIYIRGDKYYLPTYRSNVYCKDDVVYCETGWMECEYNILEPLDKTTTKFNNINALLIHRVDVKLYDTFCGVIYQNLEYFTRTTEKIIAVKSIGEEIYITFKDWSIVRFYFAETDKEYVLMSNCGRKINLTRCAADILTYMGQPILVGEFTIKLDHNKAIYTLKNGTECTFENEGFTIEQSELFHKIYIIGSTYYLACKFSNKLFQPYSIKHAAPTKTKAAVHDGDY